MDMAYFLPAQINCLDDQVEAYAAAHTQAMHCFDVEELISLFVSLAGELEKSTSKGQLAGIARQEAISEFEHLALVGARIRDMVGRLRSDGLSVTGLDAFMQSLIRCRAASDAKGIVAERDRVARGEIKSRPIQELLDELQRRDDTASR
jgi:hypothetical protein